MEDFLLAKSDGTTLKQHTIDVVNSTKDCLRGKVSDKILKIAMVAAAIHDCGKTMPSFQEYIKLNDDERSAKDNAYDGPRHSEVGYAFLYYMLDKEKSVIIRDPKELECVMCTTLYHHSLSNNDEIKFNEIYNDAAYLNKIADYYNAIFKECKIDDLICFKNNITDDILSEQMLSLDININLLNNFRGDFERIEFLKIYEIVFTVVRYVDLVLSQGKTINEERYNNIVTDEDFIIPSFFDAKRWEDQCDAANKCFNNDGPSILSATMGWGKTICGANFLLKSNKRGYWICPDNALAISTYNSLIDVLRNCGLSHQRIALLYSGNWQANNWGGDKVSIDDVDIIVTNIDTYVNGIIRNSRKDITYEALFSNSIFDEFHEYALMDSPLLMRFLTCLNARNEIKNGGKTLLLSGTAFKKGFVNINDENVINKGYEMESNKKININFITPEEYKKIYLTVKNSVHVCTSIKNCQTNYDDGNVDICFHALYDDEDLNEISNNIIYHNGKNALEIDNTTVTSTSIISRGMDISYQNAFLINPTPFMVEQITGRLNRWNIERVSNLYIIINDREAGIYRFNKKNKKYTNNNVWDKMYKPYLQKLKNEYNKREISISELKDFRKRNFDEIYLTKLVQTNKIESLKTYIEMKFTKGSYIDNNRSKTKVTKDGVDVRGESYNRFFIFYKDKENEKYTGPINIQEHHFNESDIHNGYNNIKSKEMVFDNIKRYFERNQHLLEVYNITLDKLSKMKNETMFEWLLNKAKSSDTPFPLLSDYSYDKKIGVKLKK